MSYCFNKSLLCWILGCFFVAGLQSSYANKGGQFLMKKHTTPAPKTKEFKVPGIAAWSAAKSNGFLFYPEFARGDKTGQDSRSSRVYLLGSDSITRGPHIKNIIPAQVVGGVNMLVNDWLQNRSDYDRYTYFNLFDGPRKLAPGWTVKNVVLSGSYIWDVRPRSGSEQIFSRVKVTNLTSQKGSTKAMLKELVLIGPKNGNWQDAFNVR